MIESINIILYYARYQHTVQLKTDNIKHLNHYYNNTRNSSASEIPEHDFFYANMTTVYMYVTFRRLLSQICLSPVRLSVTFVRCTQPVEIFGNISMPFCTLFIGWSGPQNFTEIIPEEHVETVFTRTWLHYVRVFAIANPFVCLCVVCKVRAPYSAGLNFRQYFYAIMYRSHPLISMRNFRQADLRQQIPERNVATFG